MSFIKKKINDFIINQFGDRVIFNQQETLDIKKKNDYYEHRLGIHNILDDLKTPAPVTGEISAMMSPEPNVRLPRIPYYEYIYYLMRWNSSILRMIGFKLKQEIFRETRLKGFDWEGKFKFKCSNCGTEFEKQLEQCEFCQSSELNPPDPTQKKLLTPFIEEANTAEQTFLEVCEEEEDDLDTVDDAYMVLMKDYVAGIGGVYGIVKEIMRGDPSRFRIVSDISGRRGKKWWVCIAHRKQPIEKLEYEEHPEKRVCSSCGLPLEEVHYVETEIGGITPKKYYIKGEVIHTSKYEPSRLYGIPPMFSVYIAARTVQLMDLYTEEYYETGKLKGILGIATDNKVELRKFMDETVSRIKNNPHYIPTIALDVGPDNKRGRMEFVKLIDSMDDLKFQEHRKMLKEEIAGLFGVNLIFLADSSTSGGLNNEGLQITVTDRTIEWGQSIYHDQFFPKLLDALGITDWKLRLKPSKETDEMAELQRFDQRVTTAQKLQDMGFVLKLLEDQFEVTGDPFVKENPQDMFNGNDQFGSNEPKQLPFQGGGNQKLLPEAQEGKPDKPKPEEEIKRSLEKERAPSHLSNISEDKLKEMTAFDFSGKVYDIADYGDKRSLDRINSMLRRAKRDEWFELGTKKYYMKEAYRSYEQEARKMEKAAGKFYNLMPQEEYEQAKHLRRKAIRAIKDPKKRLKLIDKTFDDASIHIRSKDGRVVTDNSNWVGQLENEAERELGKSLEKAACRGRIPTKQGFHPYYCPSEKVNFQFFVDSEGQAWYIGAEDDQGKDISRYVTLGNVKTAFGWYGQEVKDGRGKMMKSEDIMKLKYIDSEHRSCVEKCYKTRPKNPRTTNNETEWLEPHGKSWIGCINNCLKAAMARNNMKKDDNIDWDLLTKDNFFLINKSDKSRTNQDIIQVFDMERVSDESGQSGTGIVLSGIVFPDGKVVIRWNTETASTTEFDSWEDFEEIHIDPHPGNETKIYFYELNPTDTVDFAKSVVEPGKNVIDEREDIELHFAKELENIYVKQFEKKLRKLDDDSEQRLLMELENITREIIPKVEKLAFGEVIRSYKKGKQIDEEREETKKTIDLPEYLNEPFKGEYGAFGLDQDDWQVLRGIYRRNPFWQSFQNMSQSISDKLKQHIVESYEAPNSARMIATIRDVQKEYPDINKTRALLIAYGRIGKNSLPRIVEKMKRTIKTEVYRLERIARTESTAIVSKGREIAFQARDPEQKFKYDWFGPNDKRTSEECTLIKQIVKRKGKGKGVSLEKLKDIQEEVVNRVNPKWEYRDWVPHANCRHVIRRVV